MAAETKRDASVPSPMQAVGCKNRPTPFPGRMLYKVTKPGSVSYLSMLYIVMLFIRPLFMYVSLHFYMFCLWAILVKFSVLAK